MNDLCCNYELSENEINEVGGGWLPAIIYGGVALYGAYQLGVAIGNRIP
jgi:lactobin A/cerein 7B family class IIb bacteriocin